MARIYIDNDCKIHLQNDGTMREFDTDTEIFNGKCKGFIEGYRYVPFGETWTREDGEVFQGLMITPWRNLNDLLDIQQAYDEMADIALTEEASLMDEIEALCNELIGE